MPVTTSPGFDHTFRKVGVFVNGVDPMKVSQGVRLVTIQPDAVEFCYDYHLDAETNTPWRVTAVTVSGYVIRKIDGVVSEQRGAQMYLYDGEEWGTELPGWVEELTVRYANPDVVPE